MQTNEMDHSDFTPLEQHILRASLDSTVTLRRKKQVLAFGAVALIAPVAIGLMTDSWEWTAALATVYVLVTVWEKKAYADAVLAYKSVIRKLKRRLDDLESTPRNA